MSVAAETLVLHTRLLGDLRVSGTAAQAAALRALSAPATVYATHACGEVTGRAYRSAWSAFEAWRTSLGREPHHPRVCRLVTGELEGCNCVVRITQACRAETSLAGR